MKRKEVIQVIAAVLIFSVAGVMIYLQLAPKSAPGKAKKAAMVEVVSPLNPEFNQEALNKLSDAKTNRDFYSKPDLKNGLNNNQIFGPIQ